MLQVWRFEFHGRHPWVAQDLSAVWAVFRFQLRAQADEISGTASALRQLLPALLWVEPAVEVEGVVMKSRSRESESDGRSCW